MKWGNVTLELKKYGETDTIRDNGCYINKTNGEQIFEFYVSVQNNNNIRERYIF